jgi:phage tail protein X
MMTYSTTQGDTWDGISKRVYNDEGYVGLLIAANSEHANIVLFSAGITLQIPPLPPRPVPSGLPLWRA